jgi:hypothetical protein
MTIQNVSSYGAVQTAYVSYTSYDLDIENTNLVLFWPTPYATSPNILAATTNLRCTAEGCSINFPNANEVSLGMNVFIRNPGSESVRVNDFNGTQIVMVPPGIVFWIQLTDYTLDNAGVWVSIQQGAGTSAVIPAELAGQGLEAVNTKLNTVTFVKELTSLQSNYDLLLEDQSTLLVVSNGGENNITLPAFDAGFYFSINNIGEGTVTFTLDGGVKINNQDDFTLSSTQTLTLITDGSNWWTLGLGQSTGFVDTFISINLSQFVDITTGGSFNLPQGILDNFIHQFYSNLDNDPIEGDITIYYGDSSSDWYVSNFCHTENGSSIKIQAGIVADPLGDPILLPMDQKLIVYSAEDPISDILQIYSIPTTITSNTILLEDGTQSEPSLTFASDLTSGLYLPTQYNPSIAAHGATIVIFSGTTATLPQILADRGASSHATYSFQTSTSYGMGTAGLTLDLFAGNAAPVSKLMGSGTDTSLSLIAKPSNATTVLSSSTGGALLTHTTPSFSSSLNLVASGGASATLTFSTSGTPNLVISSSNASGTDFLSTKLSASFPVNMNLDGGSLDSTIKLTSPNASLVGAATISANATLPVGTGLTLTYSDNPLTYTSYALLNGTTTSSFFKVQSSLNGGNSSLTLTANDGGIGTITNNSVLSVSISSTGVVSFPQRAPTLNAVMPTATLPGTTIFFDGTDWIVLPPPVDGSLLIFDSGAPSWLGPGTPGDTLKMGATLPEWVT